MSRTFGTTHNTALTAHTHKARVKVVVITPVEGTPIYLIEDSFDRTIGSTTYRGGVIHSIAAVTYQANGRAGRVDIEIYTDETNISLAQIWDNALDNAPVEIYLADALNVAAGLGTDPEFAGTVAKLTSTEYGYAKIEIAGPLSRSRTLTLDHYLPMCRFTLFDPNTCGVNLATYTRTAIVTSIVGDTITFNTLSSALPAGHTFALGMGKFTSGFHDGMGFEIKEYNSGASTLQVYLKAALVQAGPGDTLELYAGCPRTPTGCRLFANRLNYGGFESIPGSDFNAITYEASSFN